MSDEKQLPPCDAEVFEKGESIGLFPGIKKEDVERLCKGLSAVTGWRIDWSYFAGRPHIRALAPAQQHQGEPSAPVEIDERAAFERAVRAEWPQAPISRKRDLLPKDDPCYGDYCDEPLQRAWVGWRMRALLESSKPTVLSKCVLCDQLQADLTERDHRIDQLEQQSHVPDGFALVPQSMLLSKEVIGVINFHCGDTDQEEGGQFGQYADGRLWVGYVLDDDGKKVHGLHIATDEYPEEGSTTLIEFPEPGTEQKPKECGACGGCTNGCQIDKDSPKAASVGAQVAAPMESRGEP